MTKKESSKKYRDNNKKEISKYMKEYYQKNKIEFKQKHKEYKKKHSKEIKEQNKEYRRMHKIKIREINKEYRRIHKNERNEYLSIQRKMDINFKILCNLRSRLCNALRGNSKLARTIQLLGCSLEFLKQHLQKQFKSGMNWKNYGNGWNGKGLKEWHIDHIVPCALFDLSKINEQRKCFHYTNLQPLWAEENLKKNRR